MTETTAQDEQREQRLKAYIDKLAALKERNLLRDILERQMFLYLMEVNHARINEYPLFDKQREGIVYLLTHRSQGHPGHEFVNKRIEDFILNLNQYSKIAGSGDDYQRRQLITTIVNIESQLIKCVQGVVYVNGLIMDNFEEVFIRIFGEESVDTISRITKEKEFDSEFWSQIILEFAEEPVRSAYQRIIAKERYAFINQGGGPALNLHFDDVLTTIKGTDKRIDKTRIQTNFTIRSTSKEGRIKARFVAEYLNSRRTEVLSKSAAREDLIFIARICSMDVTSDTFSQAYAKRICPPKAAQAGECPPGTYPDTAAIRKEMTGDRDFDYLHEVMLAMGTGASIALATTRSDFVKALGNFSMDQLRTVSPMIGSFEVNSLLSVIRYLLESQFFQVLVDRITDEGSKVRVTTTRFRRIGPETASQLEQAGLTRIQRAKLFAPDPSKQDMYMFRPRTKQDLATLVGALVMEKPLIQAISSAWDGADQRVEFLIILNMDLISKTSTNVKGRIAEILAKFGIQGQKA